MSYASEVLTDSPLGYWKLNEASGTTFADSSGNARDATLNNSSSAKLAITSPVSGSAGINLTGAYLTVPWGAWQNVSNVTIECWIRTTDLDSRVIGRDDPGNIWNFQVGPQVYFINNNSVVGNSTGQVCDGLWHHVAITYDGATVCYYIDGAASGTTTYSGAMGTSGSVPITIGGMSDGSKNTVAAISDVAVYGTAISGARIAAHYAAGAVPTDPSTDVTHSYPAAVMTDTPDLYWRLDEDQEVYRAYDSSGNGRHGAHYSDTSLQHGASTLLTDGSGKSITIPNTAAWTDISAASWMNSSNGITLEAIINVTSLPPTLSAIFSRDDASATTSIRHWVLYIDSTGKLRFLGTSSTVSVDVTSSSVLISTGVTYHVAMVWDMTANTVVVYLNGVSSFTVSGFTGVSKSDNTLPVRLGNISGSNSSIGWYLRGKIDEFAYYTKVLSSTRISAHYSAMLVTLSNMQMESTYTEALVAGTPYAQLESTYAETLVGGTPYVQLESSYFETLVQVLPATVETVYAETMLTTTPPVQTEAVYAETMLTTTPPVQSETVYLEVMLQAVVAPNFIGWGIPV